MRPRLNILLPGGFKPVHGGHIMLMKRLMDKYNTNYDVHLYVIISYKKREGYYAQSSELILNAIFGNDRRFKLILCDGSPVGKAYNLTATKEFGDGYYGMAASNKDYDYKKCEDFYNNFQPDGKYYTPGVEVIKIEAPDAVEIYSGRGDDYDGTPVSSTVLRLDLAHKNFDWFIENYKGPLKYGLVTMDELQEYFDELLDATIYPLSESGVGGHINHPYENGTMTFAGIKDMISDLFRGNIEGITEKLDGINIYASVDNKGKTIFARNMTQMKGAYLTIDSMKRNMQWDDITKEAFVKGAEVIDAVFNNIDDKISFFNYDDKADSIVYRTWYGFEIVDVNNTNVIPYVQNYVSFNNDVKTLCYDYNVGRDEWDMFDSPNVNRDIPALKAAMEKTNNTVFSTSNRPTVVINSVIDTDRMVEHFGAYLEEIMEEYGLNDESTINDFKESSVSRILFNKGELRWCSDESIAYLAKRIVDPRVANKKDITKGDKTAINKVYGDRKTILKTAMVPLERFFVEVGNAIIKLADNLVNKGNEVKAINKIKAQLTSVIDMVEKSGDEKSIEKLQYLLSKIGDETEINSSEGIVFRYKGDIYKMTGGFSVLNQILQLKRKVKPTPVKESFSPTEDYPNVLTLGDGEYNGAQWGHHFAYDGKIYYTDTGIRNMYPMYFKIVIKDGKIVEFGQTDIYQRQDLRKLFQ